MSNTRSLVLVACPTYDRKAYALNAYLEMYEGLTYPNKSLYMVDTTPHSFDYAVAIRKRGYLCMWQSANERMSPSCRLVPIWHKIVEYAHSQGYDYIASIEQDVIPPENIIETMITYIEPGCAVACSYPERGTKGVIKNGIGCALFPTNLAYRTMWSRSMFEQVVHEEMDAYVLEGLDILHLGVAGY